MNQIETAPKDRAIIIHLQGGESAMVSYRCMGAFTLDEETGEPSNSGEPSEFWEYWITTDENGEYREDEMPKVYEMNESIIGWSEINN